MSRGALRTASLGSAFAVATSLCVGCHGALEIITPLGVDDDDSALVDDDDATFDGPVSCGPTLAPGSAWAGVAVEAYTGSAAIEFDYEGRGGLFSADWTGCEAKHFFDEDGEVICGIRWAATGGSYGEQSLSTGQVAWFAMTFDIDQESCGADHPDSEDRAVFFRVTIPFEGDVVGITWSDQVDTPASDMLPWVSPPYDNQGPMPDEVLLEYAIPFVASEG